MLLWMVALLFVPCVGKVVWLSPQAQPYLVFEGDILILQCRGRKNAALSQVKFYRDEKLLHFSKNNQPLFLGTATANSSGRYNCTGQVKYARNTDSWDSGTAVVQVQEWFLPPVLTALPSHELCKGSPVTLRCQTKLHSQKSAWRLLFSFHKEGRTLQNRSRHPELHIPAAKEGDAGLYWCKASPKGGQVQKRSPQLELRVWDPQVLSGPTSSNWLVPWLPASLLAVTVIAAALLGYFRPWRKNGPLPPQNLPSAPVEEQHQLYVNVHRQNENSEGVIYSEIHTIPREHEARPAQPAQQEKDISVIYAEVKHPQLSKDPDKGLNRRSTTR
ncbi:Fc receptor-like protein 6 isoform X3 [Ovis canadensis]|uniref:Fc receptor-like protein 6 isoform X3 n=1 Tax=Ovis canadensis TaxID=37174 RepID=UPI0037523A7B